MKRERIINSIGLLLLVATFAFAAFKVLNRHRTENDPNRIVLRIAHWQLESGLRTAIEQLARDYEALHPEVTIEQVSIPERIYPQWITTQLIGGTASDIAELGRDKGTEDEILARFFLPLSDLVAQPNPYNAGTPLADTPWRDTFLDGLIGGYNYRPVLLEHYGVPLSIFTTRLFYNRDLWKELLGPTPAPTTYAEFIAICERVRAYSDRVIPIAGSRYNGPILIGELAAAQTQRLALKFDRGAILKPVNTEYALAYLRGDWGVETPAFADALAIAREVGLSMQTGYTQLGREDATFYFVQGRALMIATGSWDAPSFRALAPFEIGVFKLPIPLPDDPRYGANTLGIASEAGTTTGMSFGVTRLSKHPERAMDFLRFLTSRSANARFSQISGWLPSVIGMDVSDQIRPFVPADEGYINGFDFGLNGLGAATTKVVNNNIDALVHPSGAVSRFQDALRAALPAALHEDLGRITRNNRLNIQRQDVILAGYLGMNLHQAGAPEIVRKISMINEAENLQEASLAWIEHELRGLDR